jgi:zinc ribbon protein
MRDFYFSWHPEGVFGLLILLHFLALGFIIWMLVDAITRPPPDFRAPNVKTGWIVGLAVSLLFPFPGFVAALVYFFSVRRQAANRNAYNRMRSPDAAATPGTWATDVPPPASPTGPPPPPPPGPPPPANCRNCGAKLVTGARFCHSCGRSVD